MSVDTDKKGWAGVYLFGVYGDEVEEALWIKLPPIHEVRMLRVSETWPGLLTSDSLANFLYKAFYWLSSPEGHEYWNNHCERAKLLDSVEIIKNLREARDLRRWRKANER